MIRSLELICSQCKKSFTPSHKLYYIEDFSYNNGLQDAKLLCQNCIDAWQKHWQIKDAVFREKDYSQYVTITLENGEILRDLDCTALEDIVLVTGENLPKEAQKKLFSFYNEWDLKRKKNVLKDCQFFDEFMRTTFTCETYGGERYENIAFRFNMQGKLESEKELPDYIKEQIIVAWKMYQAQKD
ncbi:MAG: hypothetical protein PHH31_07515 [Acidaminococcaceae bacterium]|nr:hypothetical protein [Acidaminococcaceae bacterium]MDD4721748.1 hypothetical protein [Acidaminococcaceae bacterium]